MLQYFVVLNGGQINMNLCEDGSEIELKVRTVSSQRLLCSDA